MNDDLYNLDWDNVFWLMQSDDSQALLKNIPKSTLEFLLDESNKEKVVESAQKSLEKSKGKKVSWAEAEMFVEKMKVVAKKIVEGQV